MTINLDLLKALSEAAGPPGGEGPIRDILREHLRDRVDELRTDMVGNLFAVKRASRTPPPPPSLSGEGSLTTPPSFVGKGARGLGRPARILLTAHMDEAGLMVVQINGQGLLQVRAVGRMEARGLPGQGIHVGAARTPGVIGLAPPHLTSPEQRESVPDMDHLSVDIGVDTKDAATGVVKRGDYAVPATRFGQVGHLLKGKALDNRLGVAVVAALLDGDYPCDVFGVFTVQEGVGGRGARVAAYAVEPDVAIIVDGVGVDEIPDDEPRLPTPTVGAGPILPFSDYSVQLDRRLTERLMAVARREVIPYQASALVELAGDARTIQLAQVGVPTALVGLPIRYAHLPVSLAHPADLDAAERLLRLSLLGWTHDQIGV